MAVSSTIDAKPVFQSRPSDTSATAVITSKAFTLLAINICNVTSSPATFRIFHDVNGTTYDEDSALYYDKPIAGNTTVLIEGKYFVTTSGTVAVRTSVANALTFTGYAAKI